MPPKPPANPARPDVKSAARLFEARIRRTNDWRSETLARLRALIRRADPEVVEELKWKKPSNPEGEPVWSHAGILCIGNTLKRSVRLTFPKGAAILDPKQLFNARLDSRTARAIDVFEGESIDAAALIEIVRRAVEGNGSGPSRR